MARALKPGGRLVVEFGGHGNIRILLEGAYRALRQLGVVIRARGVHQFVAIDFEQGVIGKQRVMPFEVLRIDLHASPRILPNCSRR